MAKVAFWTPVSNGAPWEELWAIIKKNLLDGISHVAFFSCFIFHVIV